MDLPLILRRGNNIKQHLRKDELKITETDSKYTRYIRLENNAPQLGNTDDIIKNLHDCGLSISREYVQYITSEPNQIEGTFINKNEEESYQYIQLPHEISDDNPNDEAIEIDFDCEFESVNSPGGNDVIKYENVEILEEENNSDCYIEASDIVDEIMLFNRTDFSCSICKQQCADREDLKEHESLHLNYQCLMCDKAFYREAYLRKHLKSAHKPADSPRIPCEICNKTFKTKYNMQQHMLIHSGERRYKCTLCDKAFTQTSSLGTHMKCHMGIRQTCTVCGLPMSRIKEHMRTHTGEKPYACDICGRGFATTSQRKAHIITHTKEKKFKCQICNVLFTQLSSLYKHKKSLHGDVIKFKCPHCKKTFNRKDNLRTHIQSVHERYVLTKTPEYIDEDVDFDDPDVIENSQVKYINSIQDNCDSEIESANEDGDESNLVMLQFI